MKMFSAGVIDANGDIYPGGLEPGTVIYTADQLAQVVQQRDELLKSMKYLQEYRLWSNGHAKAIIDSAIAKVQP